MDYKEICKHIAGNDDEYIFLSGVCDKMTACQNKNIITATKFMDARQIVLVKRLLEATKCNNYALDGGTSEAERSVCLFLPDFAVEHDFYAAEHGFFKFIRAVKSRQDVLTHRDFLGSLMGLGIKRDNIGDIFVHDGGADIVVLSEIADYLMLEYKKAGRKQLSLELITKEDVNTGAGDFKNIILTVPSMRLDAVAGAIFKLSRSESAELIRKGKVFLNSAECLKPDKVLGQGDKITLRGKGRADVYLISGRTKKDRVRIEVRVFGRI